MDHRSLGYYKIEQGVIQQKLSKYDEFESAEKVCMQFNNLINTLRKEQSLDTGKNLHGWTIQMKENICQIGKY